VAGAAALIAVTVAATLIVLAGRPSTPPAPAIAYRAALVTAARPLPLDPLVDLSDPGVAELSALTYRSLLRLDGSAYPVADLASGMEESVDGLTYTLPLRPGLRWSDGNPITAWDALATIGWVQSSGFPDPGLAAEWAGVRAGISGGDLTLRLSSPRGSLPALLTQLPILPLGGLSSSEIAALVSRVASPLPTSGPYTVVGRSGGALLLAANPYADPPPRLARIELRPETSFSAAASAFSSGAVDAVVATTPAQRAQLLRRRGATAHDLLTFGFVDLLFDERVPGLGDVTVRQAIAGAIDRDSIVSGPLGGMAVAQTGPVPAGILWAARGDSGAAAELRGSEASLDQAGWLAGPGGIRSRGGVSLRYELSVADAAPLPAVARLVADQLGDLGIGVTVSVAPPGGFLGSVLDPGRFQMAIAAWDLGPDPDLGDLWASSAIPPHGFNVSAAPPDPFLDQDLEAVATLGQEPGRLAALRRVEADLAANPPAVFLYAPEESLVVSSRLHSVVVPPVGDPFADAGSWR
jgi:peptide/nickel transport system substrate-binding protein